MAAYCVNGRLVLLDCPAGRRLPSSKNISKHHVSTRQTRRWQQCRAGGGEPDWDAEMQTFRQRMMRPNQLETLRKATEEDIDVGKVLFVGDGLAIVDGVNNDAPIGTSLAFESGAEGALMWRRSDNICFVLLLCGGEGVTVGERARCKVKGVLQVVDATDGPATQRDYEETAVPAGDELLGQVVDWQGRRQGEKDVVGVGARVPLFNAQLDMDAREQIAEALTTGLRALDILTPLGRGQAQLVTGLPGAGKTLACLDAILGQAGTGVRCVYSSVGQTGRQQRQAAEALRRGGTLDYTTVVTAPEGATLGQQYGTLCAALSVAERLRDSGSHTLVVLDDVSCMTAMWDRITAALARLGPAALALQEGQAGVDVQSASQEELVEYEGMLISASAAQRRRFFSSLVQRAAKVHRRRGGGSLTLLMALPGQPASGAAPRPRPPASGYKHLSPQQREKLEAAITASGGDADAQAAEAAEGVRTEVVEEFMSVADGQTVLRGGGDVAATGVVVDARLSVSRIGSRAFPPALEALAPQIRFELAQAADTERFNADKAAVSSQAELRRAAVVQAALLQPPGACASLADEAIELVGLTAGFLDRVPPDGVRPLLDEARAAVEREQPNIVESITTTGKLSEEERSAIADTYRQLAAQATR